MPLSDIARAEAAGSLADLIYQKQGGRADLNMEDLRAGVAAADNWFETNKAAAVAALPANVQANTTGVQQAGIFAVTLLKKLGVDIRKVI